MYFDTKSIGGTVEILASNDYQAVPITVTETATIKAGMPMKNDGKKTTTGEDAIGILLYDVDPKRNPNGAVVMDGIIDWSKCQANNTDDLSGLTADAIAKLLPNIIFRDKVRESEIKTYTSGGIGAGA